MRAVRAGVLLMAACATAPDVRLRAAHDAAHAASIAFSDWFVTEAARAKTPDDLAHLRELDSRFSALAWRYHQAELGAYLRLRGQPALDAPDAAAALTDLTAFLVSLGVELPEALR